MAMVLDASMAGVFHNGTCARTAMSSAGTSAGERRDVGYGLEESRKDRPVPCILLAGRDTINFSKDSLVAQLKQDAPDANFVTYPTVTESEVHLASADVAIVTERVTPAYASAKRLRWLHLATAGIERMAIPELRGAPFVITHKSQASVVPMAEHTLAQMLGFARRSHDYFILQARRRWAAQHEPPTSELLELRGTTLALIGMGKVAQAVAYRAKAFDMRVIGIRRNACECPPFVDAVYPLYHLSSALGQADFVTLAAPLTERTLQMIGEAELSAMKPNAYLLNISRGQLVDEDALIRALETGEIAGASLDVTNTEPLPSESPLWGLPNVVITPHISGVGPNLDQEATEEISENLRRLLDGRSLLHQLDRSLIPRWPNTIEGSTKAD